MTDLSPFGRWLSDQMTREELNIVGLAELVGVSHATVYKWMRGIATPRDSNVQKLAHALRVDPVDVYRAITGTMQNSRQWPEDVHALIEDYLALPPRRRRALRNMVRDARELVESDADGSGQQGGAA